MQRLLAAVLLLLASGPALSGSAINGAELSGLIGRARLRRQEIETFFRRVFEGEAQLCARIPAPTPTDVLAEDCLQGYNLG
jgi:hypothetical protein